MSTPKEPQFFSRDAVFARGLDWYKSLFAAAEPHQLCGEASACYARWPEFGDTVRRIADHLPNAKLVYIVRHPVLRAYSHYAHEMEERSLYDTGPQLSFERALEEVPNILATSRYDVQIARYLEVFPPAALHVITLEQLRSEPVNAWRALEAFLGIPPAELAGLEERVDNQAGDRLVRVSTRRLVDRVRHAPGVDWAIRLVPQRARRAARAWLTRPELARFLMRGRVAEHRAQLSPLSDALRRRLVEELRETTDRMEAHLGRALPDWRE